MDEKYVIQCPHCGVIEGYRPLDSEDVELPPGSEDLVVEDEVFETPEGPRTRVRCPRCGQWLKEDSAHPAD